MGVVFEEIWQLPGNSVPRFHNVQGRGLGLTAPIYRECVKHPNIQFIWNSEVKELIVKDAQVIGLKTEQLRSLIDSYLVQGLTPREVDIKWQIK
jgi:predicted oxidoreductase